MWIEDCVQEQELAIWLAPDAPWKTVAHRQAIDFVRQYVSNPRTLEPRQPTVDIEAVSLEAPGDFTIGVAAKMRINQLLAGLPERLEYVVRQHMAGRTFAAIAGDLGITESRCCQLEKQAIKKIRAVAKATNGD